MSVDSGDVLSERVVEYRFSHVKVFVFGRMICGKGTQDWTDIGTNVFFFDPITFKTQ